MEKSGKAAELHSTAQNNCMDQFNVSTFLQERSLTPSHVAGEILMPLFVLVKLGILNRISVTSVKLTSKLTK